MIKKLLGLDPVRVSEHVFALDPARLSFLSLDGEAELECRDCQRESLPEDCFHSGPLGGRLKDEESFTRALDELLASLAMRPVEASLVVPDNWMRMIFVETEEWPRRRQEQLEVLRFKLSRVVPFRVEELRIAAKRVPVLNGGAAHRFLVGFGIDSALGQIERVFESRGVRIGWLSNGSLSTLQALRAELASAALAAVVRVDGRRYSVVVTRQGEPIVYRSKAIVSSASLASVGRELRLTRSFLQERIPPGIISDVILAAPEEYETEWGGLLEEVFERPASSLSREWTTIAGLVGFTTHEAAPLLGAALREVA